MFDPTGLLCPGYTSQSEGMALAAQNTSTPSGAFGVGYGNGSVGNTQESEPSSEEQTTKESKSFWQHIFGGHNETTYDENGNKMSKTVFDKDDKPTKSTNYNPDGTKATQYTYNKDGTLATYTYYAYDYGKSKAVSRALTYDFNNEDTIVNISYFGKDVWGKWRFDSSNIWAIDNKGNLLYSICREDAKIPIVTYIGREFQSRFLSPNTNYGLTIAFGWGLNIGIVTDSKGNVSYYAGPTFGFPDASITTQTGDVAKGISLNAQFGNISLQSLSFSLNTDGFSQENGYGSPGLSASVTYTW